MRRKLSQDVWVLIVLLVLLIAVGIVGGKRQSGGGIEVVPRRTSYSSRPGGVKAFFETLGKLGYQVDRQLSDLTSPPEDGTLFIIEPESLVSNSEWRSIRGWVERGNLLVVASGNFDPEISGEKQKSAVSSPTCPSFLAPDVKSYRVAELDRVEDDDWNFGHSDDFGKSGRSGISIAVPRGSPRGSGNPLAPLFRDGKGTTVGFSRWGKGGVLVLCSPWSLSNEGIGEGDNLVLALNAVNHRSRSRKAVVTFDEYHHGYSYGKGITSLLDLPAKLGLVQIGVAFMLLLFAVSRRFGSPIELREGSRQRSEYLASMSALLRKGRAAGMVQSELGHKFLEDAAVALGLPPRAEPDMILESATRRRPDKAEELRRLIAAATSLPGDDVDEASAAALARRWHRMRKELVKNR